jgi:hypothetical protein
MNIKDAFWLYNTTLWKIQRYGHADVYWYTETNKYIFKSSASERWIGRKKFIDNRKQKEFESEEKAVKWLLK